MSCSVCIRQVLNAFNQATAGVDARRHILPLIRKPVRSQFLRGFHGTVSKAVHPSSRRQASLLPSLQPSALDDTYVPFDLQSTFDLPVTDDSSALPHPFTPPPPPIPTTPGLNIGIDSELTHDEPDIQLLGDLQDVDVNVLGNSSHVNSPTENDAAQPSAPNLDQEVSKNLGRSSEGQVELTTPLSAKSEQNESSTNRPSMNSFKNRCRRTHDKRLQRWKDSQASAKPAGDVRKQLPDNLAKRSVEVSTRVPVADDNSTKRAGTGTPLLRQAGQRRLPATKITKEGDDVRRKKLATEDAQLRRSPSRINYPYQRPVAGDSVTRKFDGASRKQLRTAGPPDVNSSEEVEPWAMQKNALREKFGDSGWNPRKKLSPDALEGIRAMHTQYPDRFTTPVLADHFKVSPEAIRRILKSKWQPSTEEDERRRKQWDKRGEKIWSNLVELGVHPPKKWREMGIGGGPRRPAQDRRVREESEVWDDDRRRTERVKRDGNDWVASLAAGMM